MYVRVVCTVITRTVDADTDAEADAQPQVVESDVNCIAFQPFRSSRLFPHEIKTYNDSDLPELIILDWNWLPLVPNIE